MHSSVNGALGTVVLSNLGPKALGGGTRARFALIGGGRTSGAGLAKAGSAGPFKRVMECDTRGRVLDCSVSDGARGDEEGSLASVCGVDVVWVPEGSRVGSYGLKGGLSWVSMRYVSGNVCQAVSSMANVLSSLQTAPGAKTGRLQVEDERHSQMTDCAVFARANGQRSNPPKPTESLTHQSHRLRELRTTAVCEFRSDAPT